MIKALITFFLPALILGSDNLAIDGIVLNSENAKPINMVNVYLANSTKGSATDKEGKFHIPNITKGIYDLIVVHIGFEHKTIHVNLLRNIDENIVIKLKPIILEGQQIQVEAEYPTEWKKQLSTFTREFIGNSNNSKYCTIINPEVIDFKYDKSIDCLFASSDRIIKIQNNTLGYTIDLLLENFTFQNGRVSYTIFPYFSEFSSNNAKYQQARVDTYFGSFKHFLSALTRNRLKQEKFEIYRGKRENGKIKTKGRSAYVNIDSLIVLPTMDTYLKKIHFDNYFVVLSKFYPNMNSRSQMRYFDFYEPAYVRMKLPEAIVDTLGNVHTINAFTTSGYWFDQRVADLLPNEYTAEAK
ncbi:carboxypeptidase-like regulatory domain-containing protein [candidate division KSB1 bacterium]|nr:carboxypeptidase-like regulatory domain-containing protein [candidate division KSB1 bacterium]